MITIALCRFFFTYWVGTPPSTCHDQDYHTFTGASPTNPHFPQRPGHIQSHFEPMECNDSAAPFKATTRRIGVMSKYQQCAE